MKDPDLIFLSPRRFLAGCGLAAALLVFGRVVVPPAVIAAEVVVTVLLLFLLGSFRLRLDKNALTYGAALVIAASFWTGWWPRSGLRDAVAAKGPLAAAAFVRRTFLSFSGLDGLIHLDTMLFILGLTFFVAAIARTRLLESLVFAVVRRADGRLLLTVAFLTALVSAASGVLDGVSMIGLLIRVLTVLLFVARASDEDRTFFVILSTVVTTVCGMWLAYGEPPNLIMKANLAPRLTDGFFLRYCLPVALSAYGVLWLHMRRRLGGRRIDPATLPAFDRHPDAQIGGALSFAPFVALLIAHAVNHRIPLFLASFAGAAGAFFAIRRHAEMRRIALHEARHEFAEYLFLLPLFFSISLLMRTGFFEGLERLLRGGAAAAGPLATAFAQFTGATFLSAILDNNVVADFASHALTRLPDGLLRLFAMAQIAGYAIGGCWTHIGSAQSVVAYAFIRKDVNARFTPMDWIRTATPLVLQIAAVAAAVIALESAFLAV